MRAPATLTAKLVAIGATFLAVALVSIGVTLWVAWHLEGGAAAVNEAGRLRMMTWRLVATASASSPGEVTQQLARFEEGLALLRDGDASRPLFVPRDAATTAHFERVAADWQVLRASWVAGTRPPLDLADAFVRDVDLFVAAIERDIARWTAILGLVQFGLVGLAIAGGVALLYTGYVVVLDPVARLAAGVAKVTRGQFDARVELDVHDEFGRLAKGFNDMARALHQLYGQLEEKVREKTAGLERHQERLAVLYHASAFLARAQTLEQMGQGLAREIRRVARADAVAVRWSDEANERYVLVAGDCLPQALADAEAWLPTGSCACGQPQHDAATRVIPIHAGGERPMPACAAAGYATMVAVPVRQADRVLGEIEIFYRGVTEPAADERELFETLASHLAGAMEGLRAGALAREAAVAAERALLARELHDSIAQSLAFLKIQVQMLRGALARRDEAAVARVVDELDAGIRESTGDVRELLLNFRTRTADESIEPALRSTLAKFELQTGLRPELAVHGHGLPLAPDVQVQVLHVVQEALSNVRKHAQARHVWVEVEQAPHWRFEVRDDGIGFDPEHTGSDATHVGLGIMRERAARIGATVQIDSVPGAGSCVTLELPSAAAEAPPPAALAA